MNPYDLCVYNKVEEDGKQITIVVHVDDLLVTSISLLHIDTFGTYLKSVYPETKTSLGQVLDYVGMTFDFTKEGEIDITMDNCVGKHPVRMRGGCHSSGTSFIDPLRCQRFTKGDSRRDKMVSYRCSQSALPV